MKRNLLLKFLMFSFVAFTATLIFSTCKKAESPGSIYGVITDKATSEPIRAAGVQLNPLGIKTVTGDGGEYEFAELKAGEYTLQVTKTGYTDLLNYKMVVQAGKTAKGDVQIEKLPPSLRVVDDKKNDIDSLDFGSSVSDVTRSFSVFNDGPESLEWEISNAALWITKISKESGTLKAGATQAIIVTIDRDKLSGGANTTTIHITSDNGSKELKVNAVGENKTLPSLNTLSATNITSSTATFNGEITAVGLPAYTERGFVYSTTTMPTIETTVAKLTAAVTENAAYSANATNLTLDQTYYVRAYALNGVGTAYSTNEVSFVATAAMPTLSTQEVTNINIAAGVATFNGTVLSVGDPAYTERGFVYGVTHNPTIDDTKKTVSGSGTGAFSANVTGIDEGNIYYVRAYATNSKGTAYGAEVSFDYVAAMPTLTTQAVTNINIGAGTATFNGTVVSVGDLAYTERGFAYGVAHNPTIDDTKKVVSGSGTGTFSTSITELSEGNTYYVRAYVTNSKGTVYGAEVSFDYNAAMPTLTTQAVTNINIGAGTATFNGTVVSVGDPAYTERGFVYGVTHNPTVDDDTKKTVSGSGTGAFSSNVTGIDEGNIYYVRAYATNSKGTVYGAQISFKPEVREYVILEVAGIAVQKTDITENTIHWTDGNALCENSTLNGYTDWRLPTIDELGVIYNNKEQIEGLYSGGSPTYWSSTRYNSSSYYVLDMTTGSRVSALDNYNGYSRTRCVRTLP
ncbi:MAG: DUF1566 domain-containing protein [Bacteroidales bacterium]|jgi:hypothetical protein|nr:DUF1566 domain-containing protein [Bacteroidales bacterium]